MKTYGKELILDLHNCDVSTFNRKSIRQYLIKLCDSIDMQREDLHWWDYKDDPSEYEKAPVHLKGISCVQFITTSNIVIHTKDVLETINVNIFSCKEFESKIVEYHTQHWFKGRIVSRYFIDRY